MFFNPFGDPRLEAQDPGCRRERAPSQSQGKRRRMPKNASLIGAPISTFSRLYWSNASCRWFDRRRRCSDPTADRAGRSRTAQSPVGSPPAIPASAVHRSKQQGVFCRQDSLRTHGLEANHLLRQVRTHAKLYGLARSPTHRDQWVRRGKGKLLILADDRNGVRRVQTRAKLVSSVHAANACTQHNNTCHLWIYRSAMKLFD